MKKVKLHLTFQAKSLLLLLLLNVWAISCAGPYFSDTRNPYRIDNLLNATVKIESKTNDFLNCGLGVLTSADGHIITGYHVIKGALQITVSTREGKSFPAKILFADPVNDLAFLKIDARLLPHITPSWLPQKVGEPLLCIGTDCQGKLGIYPVRILAQNRIIQTEQGATYSGLFSIGIPLRPGCSGGPLVNSRSFQLVGICLASNETETFAKPVQNIQMIK